MDMVLKYLHSYATYFYWWSFGRLERSPACSSLVHHTYANSYLAMGQATGAFSLFVEFVNQDPAELRLIPKGFVLWRD